MINSEQQKLVDDLKNGITTYRAATIYTAETENIYEQSKNWKWS